MAAMVDRNLSETLALRQKPKTYLVMIPISAFVILTSDEISFETMKVLFIIQVMIYASYYDVATKKVDRRMHIIIMAIGSMLMPWQIFAAEAIPGMMVMPLPLIITGLIYSNRLKKNVVGVGDIYYVGALSYAFGITVGMVGMLLTTIISFLFSKATKQTDSIAFVPSISIGYIIAILGVVAY